MNDFSADQGISVQPVANGDQLVFYFGVRGADPKTATAVVRIRVVVGGVTPEPDTATDQDRSEEKLQRQIEMAERRRAARTKRKFVTQMTPWAPGHPSIPVDVIIEQAEELDVDLIAMATHGHGRLPRMVYGSVAEKVRHRTNVPLLLVKATLGTHGTPAADQAQG
jgi:nucleotide-binding universal stress UspA family protein